MNIVQAINSEKIFRPLFKDLRTWENWIVCLKAIFGLEMTDEEYEIYKQFTGRTDRPNKQFSECFILSGRRSGKTFTSGLIAVFLACFKEWDLGLQKGHIVCLAKDRDQAGEVFRYIVEILRLPVLQSMVVNETKDAIELNNGMVISVKTCSFRALRGYQICAVVCDEVSFWYDTGANPAIEILRAVRPSLGSLPQTLLLCITSVYAQRGIIYETHKAKFGKNDDRVLVWTATTSEMNPVFDKDYIDRALVDDPSVARAEYFSIFRQDLEGFFATKEVERVIIPGREQLEPQEGVFYFGFCDPSGGGEGGDSMTLAIAHREESKIIQDRLIVQKAPFDTDDVTREFAGVLREYRIYEIEGDRYAGNWPKQSFEKHSICFEHSELTKSGIYMEARSLFSSNRLEILDIPVQTNELRGLERKTTREKVVIDHPQGSSDDCANSLCGVIARANRTLAVRTPDPSYGLTEPIAESETEKMARESQIWLLGIPKKKKPKNDDPNNLDLDELEAEMMDGLEEEVATEIRKDSSKGVQFKRW